MHQSYLKENFNFDYSSERIQQLIEEIIGDDKNISSKDYALTSYYYIRDSWPYDPSTFSLVNEDWKASEIVTRSSGHCLDKAILYISVLRAKGIPARLGLAKVKNHIAVEDVLEKFGNDVLVPHGYVEVYLNNKWVKATPAFNKSLCDRLGVTPLDFDGENDSLFHPYTSSGDIQFMEYLEDYGIFNDVPLEIMLNLMKETYPVMKKFNIQLGMVLNLDMINEKR